MTASWLIKQVSFFPFKTQICSYSKCNLTLYVFFICRWNLIIYVFFFYLKSFSYLYYINIRKLYTYCRGGNKSLTKWASVGLRSILSISFEMRLFLKYDIHTSLRPKSNNLIQNYDTLGREQSFIWAKPCPPGKRE